MAAGPQLIRKLLLRLHAATFLPIRSLSVSLSPLASVTRAACFTPPSRARKKMFCGDTWGLKVARRWDQGPIPQLIFGCKLSPLSWIPESTAPTLAPSPLPRGWGRHKTLRAMRDAFYCCRYRHCGYCSASSQRNAEEPFKDREQKGWPLSNAVWPPLI